MCFSGSSDGKESAWNVGDLGLIPGWRKSSREGNGYPLQYSCLENPMDRGAWGATVMGTFTFFHFSACFTMCLFQVYSTVVRYTYVWIEIYTYAYVCIYILFKLFFLQWAITKY